MTRPGVKRTRTCSAGPGTVAATLIPVLGACAPDAAPDPTIAIDSADVRIVTSDPESLDATCTISGEPVLVIGEDEEDEDQWFSSVRGMGRLSDGSVAAVDRTAAEVRIFDMTGRHLRSMGRRGEGPGEFADPYVLWITAGDTLWVGDYRPWRYNVFTAGGEFVRRVTLTPVWPNPARAGGVLDNGYSVNARAESMRNEGFAVADTMVVEVHTPEGALVGNLARLPDRTSGTVPESPNFWLFPLFQSFARIDARGSTIVLGHGSKTEVRLLDDDFNLRTIIRWSEPDREVTPADVRASREDYIESRRQFGSREWDEYDDTRLSDERPVADLFPAISRVMIGRDGRIWVRQYDRPRENRGWLAFGADGAFVCHLAGLPGEVWEIGHDYVLLLGETELGIQTVQMYRLNPPETVDSAG